jgi:predicted PurR-regulated permease PerM
MSVQPLDAKLGRWCKENRGILVIAIPALLLIFYFLFPFLDGIILGTVFAYVGRPIKLSLKEHPRLGSLIATFAIIIPIFVILGLGVVEIANFFLWLAEHQREIMLMLNGFVGEIGVPDGFYSEISGSIQNILGTIVGLVASIPIISIGRSFTLGLVNFIIAVPVCYFLLLDGEKFIDSVISLLPDENKAVYRRYFARIDWILSGIFLGSIYTSIVGSLISAAVFYAFGLPRPFALASFVFIAGMVPVLTATAVIVPIALYKYATVGLANAAIFFIVSTALIYLPSELAIRPYLVSSKSSIHPLLVMLSFFGGAIVAGIGGFFLAPALMGVVIGIYQVRREEMESCAVAK